jgi:DNA polymerase-4
LTRAARDPAAPADDIDVLHVDMDCFFAAVEALEDPSLAGKPVIVGGSGPRGVVASCSYEARAFGVRSAMPSAEARRLCPQAVFLDGRYDTYAATSRRLQDIFEEFTPVIEPIALDEAFLDVSNAHRLFGPSPTIAGLVRERVAAELGLSCAVGVARTKLIAKLASRAAKPNASPTGTVPGRGVVVVRPEEELAFLQPLPVRALPGVGPKTAERLRRYGVSTVSDLAAVGRSSLVRLLGSAHGSNLHDLALGHDPRPVTPGRPLKSVGHEETFAADDHDAESLHRQAVRMSDAVAARMRAAGVVGRTVAVKARFADFSMVTRSQTLRTGIASAHGITRVAAALLASIDVSAGVRLLGVAVSSLERAAGAPDGGEPAGPAQTEQLRLDAESAEQESARSEIDRAVDAIRRRYGTGAIGAATVVSSAGIGVKRPGDRRWGPPAEG